MTTPTLTWTEHEAALVAILADDPSPTERSMTEDALADVRDRIARGAQNDSEAGRESE
jgi:hypothetical protein